MLRVAAGRRRLRPSRRLLLAPAPAGLPLSLTAWSSIARTCAHYRDGWPACRDKDKAALPRSVSTPASVGAAAGAAGGSRAGAGAGAGGAGKAATAGGYGSGRDDSGSGARRYPQSVRAHSA